MLIADLDWPIYFSRLEAISDVDSLLETDGSLTINFNSPVSDYLRNHRYYLSCDSQKLALVETNYYLLPQLVIDHLWPSWKDRILINTIRPDCLTAQSMTVERR